MVRGEIGPRFVEQLLVVIDHEVDVLKIINAITGAHDPYQIEGDARGRLVLKAID